MDAFLRQSISGKCSSNSFRQCSIGNSDKGWVILNDNRHSSCHLLLAVLLHGESNLSCYHVIPATHCWEPLAAQHALMGSGLCMWSTIVTHRPVSQIPQCTSPTPHNASFCNKNVHMCAHFCYKMVHCRMRDICLMLCGNCEMGLLVCLTSPTVKYTG